MGQAADVMEIETCFGPADFAALPGRDLAGAVCVVFDVLRATTTAITALANGARAIRPVSTVEEALAERAADPSVLLAGERGGLRIGADRTGGVPFDFGNSPREFGPERVGGRTLVMTTTNGTRALKASAGAGMVVAAGFVNLSEAVARVVSAGLGRVVLVCSGTGEEPALEDALAAGAFAERLALGGPGVELADSAAIALGLWRSARPGFESVLVTARNARRLMSMPDLAADVPICMAVDRVGVVPVLVGGRELRLV
jgi:2-phosphosulfolactate phosphatase